MHGVQALAQTFNQSLSSDSYKLQKGGQKVTETDILHAHPTYELSGIQLLKSMPSSLFTVLRSVNYAIHQFHKMAS